jgi:hypothetical protein
MAAARRQRWCGGRKGRLDCEFVRSEVDVSSSSDFTGFEGEPFVDKSTNKNQPKDGVCLRGRLIGKGQFKLVNLTFFKKNRSKGIKKKYTDIITLLPLLTSYYLRYIEFHKIHVASK